MELPEFSNSRHNLWFNNIESYILRFYLILSTVALFVFYSKRFLKIMFLCLLIAIPPSIWIARNQTAYHTSKVFLSLNGVIFAKNWNSTVLIEYNNKSIGASDEAVDVKEYFGDVNLSDSSEMAKFEILKSTSGLLS